MEHMLTLPHYAERKGSLLLRSNHCSFRKGVLNTNWHQMREAEPKDYDIRHPDNYNLHKSTYGGYGCVTVFSSGPPISEMKERMSDLHNKSDFEKKEIHKLMLDQDAFKKGNWERVQQTSLTRHAPHHNKMFFGTTSGDDFKPSYSYKPKEIKNVSIKPTMKYRKTHSELYDRTDHRRSYCNTWQDEYKVAKSNDGPSTVIRGAPMKTPRRLPFITTTGASYQPRYSRYPVY